MPERWQPCDRTVVALERARCPPGAAPAAIQPLAGFTPRTVAALSPMAINIGTGNAGVDGPALLLCAGFGAQNQNGRGPPISGDRSFSRRRTRAASTVTWSPGSHRMRLRFGPIVLAGVLLVLS
jgi:hypothetical protein